VVTEISQVGLKKKSPACNDRVDPVAAAAPWSLTLPVRPALGGHVRLLPCGVLVAVLEVAVLEVAVLEVAVLEVAVLEVAGATARVFRFESSMARDPKPIAMMPSRTAIPERTTVNTAQVS
jgi:hypothetical protein